MRNEDIARGEEVARKATGVKASAKHHKETRVTKTFMIIIVSTIFLMYDRRETTIRTHYPKTENNEIADDGDGSHA